jgi:hypothetical protein
VVEHVVPLLVIAPLPGIAIVCVTPIGTGLDPGDVISVAPNGIPVVPTEGPNPSGVVASSEGVAVIGSSTWASAGPAHNNNQAVATINNGLMQDSPIKAEGAQQSSILRRSRMKLRKNQQRKMFNFVSDMIEGG